MCRLHGRERASLRTLSETLVAAHYFYALLARHVRATPCSLPPSRFVYLRVHPHINVCSHARTSFPECELCIQRVHVHVDVHTCVNSPRDANCEQYPFLIAAAADAAVVIAPPVPTVDRNEAEGVETIYCPCNCCCCCRVFRCCFSCSGCGPPK